MYVCTPEEHAFIRTNHTQSQHHKKKKERKLHNAFGLEKNFLKTIRYAKGTARRAFSYWLVSKSFWKALSQYIQWDSKMSLPLSP